MAKYDQDTNNFMDSFREDGVIKTTRLVKSTARLADNLKHGRTGAAAQNAYNIAKTLKPDHEKHAEVRPSAVMSLYRILNTKFDKEWYDWEPETLWVELERIGQSANAEIKNAVMALQVCMNSNSPFEEWHVFENVGHAFAGNDVNFSIVQPLEMTEVAAAMRILHRIRPREIFSDEVCGYIAGCAMNAGMVYLPEDLFPGDCQKALNQLIFTKELRDQTQAAWPKVMAGEEPLAIQLQKLHEVSEYVNPFEV